ncbi:hypothetical protein [Parasphingorhabdus sp.]
MSDNKTKTTEDERKMQADSPSSAGGFLLAVGCIAGAIVGVFFGQPSIGFLAGLALGALGALAIWMRDRARH